MLIINRAYIITFEIH